MAHDRSNIWQRISPRGRVRTLGLSLTVMAASLAVVAVFVGYQTGFEQQRNRLADLAAARAGLIEAMARFDAEFSQNDVPGGALAATLGQISDAEERFAGLGQTGEFVLALQDSGRIRFLLLRHGPSLEEARSMSASGRAAEPMRRALSGQTGTMVGPDYRGRTVLAAYRPVEGVPWALVGKIDMAEIRRPYLEAGLYVALATLLLLGLGWFLMGRLIDPVLEELEASEARYRGLFETSRDAIYITSRSGRILEVNAAFEELFRYDARDLIGMDVRELYAVPDQREEFQREIERHGAVSRRPVTLVRGDGSEVFCEETAVVRVAEDGDVMGYQGIVRDVTERVRLLDRLREGRDRARRYLDIVEEMIVALGPDGHITMVNRAALDILGYEREEDLLGADWFRLCLPADTVDAVWAIHQQVMDGEASVRHVDGPVRTATGQIRIIAWRNTVVRDADGTIVGTLSSGRDVTEQREVEQDLRTSQAELRGLAARLHSVREEERAMVARELHDELGQKLSAIRMDLEMLGQELARTSGADDNRLADTLRLTDDSLATVRNLSARMRPPVLDVLGLSDAIQLHAQEFAARSGIDVDLRIDAGGLPVRDQMDIVVFRILQEALTNVGRHSRADRVVVALSLEDGALLLTVEDDGVGFAPGAADSRESIGLIGMRERAGAVGGEVIVDSAPGQGTRVTARMPLKPAGVDA